MGVNGGHKLHIRRDDQTLDVAQVVSLPTFWDRDGFGIKLWDNALLMSIMVGWASLE